jgi:hypothetical protein
MEYPIDMISKFRNRMGWQQPERTASFPSFDSGSFQTSLYDMPGCLDPNSYQLLGNPSFSVSHDHLQPYIKSQTSDPITPLSLDPFTGATGQHNYLGIPSPSLSGYTGYHSPSGSSFGDVAYSDQGGDDYTLFESSLPGPSAFGGFVPHTVWIN